MYHYTYLITNLAPASQERYYIGVRTSDEHPAHDSYMGSSEYLSEDLRNLGLAQFEKVIIKNHSTRAEADHYERQLHIEHNAAKNPSFYNKKNGVVGFHNTTESVAKGTITINNPGWKDTIGKESIQKQKETITNPQWQKTVGKQARLKAIQTYKATINSPSWQQTTGQSKSKKLSDKQQDPQWKAENTFTCDHCSKSIVGKGMFVRWHGDNCKLIG